jgi:putative transposase
MDKIFYERNLPHLQPPGGTFFLTYRLHGSIPMSVLQQIKADSEAALKLARESLCGPDLTNKLYEIHRRSFGQYDNALDGNPNGPYWLGQEAVAQEVVQSLGYCAKHFFHLWAYCIMPNHVHLLIKHHEDAPLLCDIMKRHKSYTGRVCNQLIGETDKFWNRETYDHLVRNQKEFDRIAWYILSNPVKAKLVEKWQDWPYTYAHPDLWL